MSKSNFKDVGLFHDKFGLDHTLHGPNPMRLMPDVQRFREGFMLEELKEFMDSYNQRDLAGCADALVDLVYVAMGTAQLMGLPWEELWDEVQRANMEKIRAPNAMASKRGHHLDVIKPEGWVGPDIEGVLAKWDK